MFPTWYRACFLILGLFKCGNPPYRFAFAGCLSIALPPDLVHSVQPLSLLLNGITALFSLVGLPRPDMWTGGEEEFWRWHHVIRPDRSYLAQLVSPIFIWSVYFVSVFICVALMHPHIQRPGKEISDWECCWPYPSR